MIRQSRFLIMLATCATLVFTSCKDDDDIPALEYSEQGFIKGTIKGTTSDGKTTIDETFNYTRYSTAAAFGEILSGYSVDGDGSIEIQVVRQDLSTGAYVALNFSLDNAADVTPAYDIQVFFIRETENILVFTVSTDDNDDDNEHSVTNFSFDKASGIMKGDFMISGDGNSTERPATVTGSFDVQTKQVIN